MRTTVIISAFKNHKALKYCLYAYAAQTIVPDQIIIAEDDQAKEVAELIKQTKIDGVDISHVSQPNNGFGKWKIVNKAVKQSFGDLLIFTDADCIPRNDFIEIHKKESRRGCFLSGGSHIDIPIHYHEGQDISTLIENQNIFNYDVLSKIPGFKKSRWRLTKNKAIANVLDILTQRDAFSGASASAYREDILAIKGFDESITYGGGDINIGIRLNNYGIKGRRKRYSICYVHLDHPRGYANKEIILKNKKYNKNLRSSGIFIPLESSLL